MSTIEKALAKKSKNKSDQPKEDVIKQGESLQPQEDAPKTSEAPGARSGLLQLDRNDLAARGFLCSAGERSTISDEFRHIKRKVINNAFGKASKTLENSNLVMISSSKPNEGKTFVSINMALSIAMEQDKTVLLVDADVLRPSINRELGIETTPGLIEYLLGKKSDISEVIYSTSIEKLKIIPAGEPHHLSNELLASDRMHELTKELSARYPDRIVIFDCPPLLGVTETNVLSSLMGQALVVVEESKTKLEDIKKATENLNEDLAIGLVLNKTIRSHKDAYGYYGYGYNSQ